VCWLHAFFFPASQNRLGIMALVSCPECSKEVSSQAVACPHCGLPLGKAHASNVSASQPSKPANWAGIRVMFYLLIFVGFTLLCAYRMNEINHPTDKSRQQDTDQITADAIREYEIARQSGNASEAYVHAAAVAEAFLQAHDQANYQKWVNIRRTEALRAGVPEE
jgi:hypothetical protein